MTHHSQTIFLHRRYRSRKGWFPDSRRWRKLAQVAALVILCTFCGCQESDSNESTDSKSATTASDSAITTPAISSAEDSGSLPAPEVSPNPKVRRADEVWEDANGRRYIGKVPYDIFFDHPLTVATNDQLPTHADDRIPDPALNDGSITSVSKFDEVDTKLTAETPSGTDWALLLPANVLESEVKSARNFLNQKLQSVGNYNSAVTVIPVTAATIAVLAGIAIEHSENVSWQEDAGYIRDLAASMNESPLHRGPKDQRRLLAFFENLTDTLNRSRPSGLPEPDPETALSDVAQMRLVMMRMQESEQRLRTEVNALSFESRKDLVLHEAALLTGLIQAVTTESYGFDDDPEFNAFAQQITDSGLAMRDAADAGNFGKFELNLSRITGTCQACHRDYKSN